MDEDYGRDLGITAAAGCATGFLWSVLAGKADLSEGKGWAYAAMGCLGSAAQGATLYSGTRFVTSRFGTENPELARQITAGWFGIQTAASFTNMLGTDNGWQNEPAYNAVALPLNYAAAPLFSTGSLIMAGIGEAAIGFSGRVHVFGGTLIFHDKVCLGNGGLQGGAVGHYCKFGEGNFHEVGHAVQFSILGEVGIVGSYLVNGAYQLIVDQGVHPRRMLLEQWADDFETQTEDTFKRRKFGVTQGPMRFEYSLSGTTFWKGENRTSTVQGINVEGYVSFHQNARLKTATLAADHWIAGTLYRKGTNLTLDENGKILEAQPSVKEKKSLDFHLPLSNY